MKGIGYFLKKKNLKKTYMKVYFVYYQNMLKKISLILKNISICNTKFFYF